MFDVSGAGNTAIAFLTAALAAGESFVNAAKLANLVSGIVVGKTGTAIATPQEMLRSRRPQTSNVNIWPTRTAKVQMDMSVAG
jgi:D-beta-D-heptose 7-phosphate kinase/D-beta-D-heptose 1-phosphate adenosyltransferase